MQGVEEKKFDAQFVREMMHDLGLVQEMLPELIKEEKGEGKRLLQQVEEEFKAIMDLLSEHEHSIFTLDRSS